MTFLGAAALVTLGFLVLAVATAILLWVLEQGPVGVACAVLFFWLFFTVVVWGAYKE